MPKPLFCRKVKISVIGPNCFNKKSSQNSVVTTEILSIYGVFYFCFSIKSKFLVLNKRCQLLLKMYLDYYQVLQSLLEASNPFCLVNPSSHYFLLVYFHRILNYFFGFFKPGLHLKGPSSPVMGNNMQDDIKKCLTLSHSFILEIKSNCSTGRGQSVSI